MVALKGTAAHRLLLAGRVLILLLLAAPVALSGKWAAFLDPYGLAFVVIGGAAGALMTFTGREIRTAFSHAGGCPGSAWEITRSAFFWGACARNFWVLGVLRSILSFVISLGNLSGGLAVISSGLANSLLAAVYGMILAAACLVPCWKLEAQRDRAHDPEYDAALSNRGHGATRSGQFSRLAGYLLFVAMLLSTLLRPSTGSIGAVTGWIIYWPSLLLVVGGTLALLLFLGDAAAPSAISPGFALTGFIGSLMGFVQVLFGLSAGSIDMISSALTFILSSCFAALMGMFLFGGPREGRADGMFDRSPASLPNRLGWYAFPLLALIFLVAVFLLIVTPFERHQ